MSVYVCVQKSSFASFLRFEVTQIIQEWILYKLLTNRISCCVSIFLTLNQFFNPAVVAWLAKASVFHSVNLALSANSGSNPAREDYMVPWPLLLNDNLS